MPIFEYKAFAPGGEIKKGIIDADSPREARQKLRRENILVSEIRARGRSRRTARDEAAEKQSVLGRIKRLRSPQTGAKGKNLDIVTAATRQLGTLLAAGIPLTEALRALVEQAQDRSQEQLFREIRERVSQGSSLADAMAEQPAWFTELYVNMVRAGQATGNLDVVFNRLADYMQSQRALRRKVVSAMIYPAMMITIGLLVVSILMAFVVPKITEMLIDQGQTLPAPTQILILVSSGFRDYWWAGFLLVGLASYVFERVYHRSDRGRLAIDRSLLRIPLIGEVLRKQSISRFTHTLATLLSSGVNVVQSLEVTGRVVGNRVIADATDHIRTRIVEGTDIATPLKQTGVFPATVGYMVAVGEASGELEQMLTRVGTAYDEEIELVTERLTSVLEPILIVVLAGVVGFIVIAIVLPILQVGNIQ